LAQINKVIDKPNRQQEYLMLSTGGEILNELFFADIIGNTVLILGTLF